MRNLLGLILFATLLIGCEGPPVQSPITVEEVYYHPSGTQCYLRLKLSSEGRGVKWTTESPENCQYKKGDILK